MKLVSIISDINPIYIVLGVIGLLILIIVIRALTFNSKLKKQVVTNREIDDTIVNELCTLLKYKTVSHEDNSNTVKSVLLLSLVTLIVKVPGSIVSYSGSELSIATTSSSSVISTNFG